MPTPAASPVASSTTSIASSASSVASFASFISDNTSRNTPNFANAAAHAARAAFASHDLSVSRRVPMPSDVCGVGIGRQQRQRGRATDKLLRRLLCQPLRVRGILELH